MQFLHIFVFQFHCLADVLAQTRAESWPCVLVEGRWWCYEYKNRNINGIYRTHHLALAIPSLDYQLLQKSIGPSF